MAEPRAFVLENVEGLVTMDDGETMAEIVAALESVGYAVGTRVFDARGWVPQSRKRVFFVGFRSDLRAARRTGVFTWPEEPRDGGGTVKDVLEDEHARRGAVRGVGDTRWNGPRRFSKDAVPGRERGQRTRGVPVSGGRRREDSVRVIQEEQRVQRRAGAADG